MSSQEQIQEIRVALSMHRMRMGKGSGRWHVHSRIYTHRERGSMQRCWPLTRCTRTGYLVNACVRRLVRTLGKAKALLGVLLREFMALFWTHPHPTYSLLRI